MTKFLDDTGLARVWANLKSKLNAKQDKLTGQPGQVVGFDENGAAIAQDASGGGGSGGGLPSGCIVIWSGASTAIPDGWALCNGTNGTPDLRDRFVLGAGSTYAVGATGGEATHKLTISEMPSHFHEETFRCNLPSLGANRIASCDARYATTTDSAAPSYNVGATVSGPRYYIKNISGDQIAQGTNVQPLGTVNAGGGAAHNNMPPYYALCYIMKL